MGQLAVQGQPYFLVETPNKETLFGRINPGFPIQVLLYIYFITQDTYSLFHTLTGLPFKLLEVIEIKYQLTHMI